MTKPFSRLRMISRQVSQLSALATLVGGLSLGCSGATSQESNPLEALRAPEIVKAPATTGAKLEALRVAAVSTGASESEKAYLAAFPRTFTSFKEMFATSDPASLESRYVEHLGLLEKLSNKYPSEVASVWIDTCVGGSWEADAVGLLQTQVTDFAAKNPRVFAAAVSKKSADDQKSIVRFLADVENPDENFDYERAIVGLEGAKQQALATEFITAREKRERESSH